MLATVLTPLMTTGAHAAETTAETSVDLYCKSLSFGFMDTYRYLHTKQNERKLESVGIAMEESCRLAPSVAPLKVANMKPAQITVITCFGFATGAQLAHQVGLPAESYAMLSKRRDFAVNACRSGPKRFQEDVFKRGPDYVLSQKY